MNKYLILFVGTIYFSIAIQYALQGKWALSVVFLGYAFSNVGLYIIG